MAGFVSKSGSNPEEGGLFDPVAAGVGDGGSAAAAPGGDGREAAEPVSSRLESSPNNRNSEKIEVLEVRPHSCRARTCEQCGPRYGRIVRSRLLGKEGHFKRPGLLTFTVDRKAFTGPSEAFVRVCEKGYIRRILRLLKVKCWVWVLEFQMQTGEGWPHWHILVDLPDGGIDLERAWRLWRDRWGLGMLDLQRKAWTANSQAALLYISKYLCKFPREGFPRWVEHFDRRIRWMQTSKAVGAVFSDAEATVKDAAKLGLSGEALESMPRGHRTYAERKVDCGELVVLFIVIQVGEELRKRFLARMPRELFEAATRGSDPLPVEVDADGRVMLKGSWTSMTHLFNDMMNRAADQLRHKGGVMSIARKRLKRIAESLRGEDFDAPF